MIKDSTYKTIIAEDILLLVTDQDKIKEYLTKIRDNFKPHVTNAMTMDEFIKLHLHMSVLPDGYGIYGDSMYELKIHIKTLIYTIDSVFTVV